MELGGSAATAGQCIIIFSFKLSNINYPIESLMQVSLHSFRFQAVMRDGNSDPRDNVGDISPNGNSLFHRAQLS
jgi:hypothetical protein